MEVSMLLTRLTRWWDAARRSFGGRNAGRADTRAANQGIWGEKIAARHLQANGYRIVGKRVRMSSRDELDLVAVKDATLVFVEVKTRADETFGRPAAAVTAAKRRSWSRAAVRYLQRMPRKPDAVRFDLVEVIGVEDGAEPVIRHIENVMTLDSRYKIAW